MSILEDIEELAEEYIVHLDETRILFLKIIEQSIRDFVNLRKSTVPIEQDFFETAKSFLFDPNHKIDWFVYEIGLEEILQYLNIDYEWFMRKLYTLL
jgi:hypothetical protein